MSLAALTLPTQPLIEDADWCLTMATAPIVRTCSEWVEQEIILPNGPFGGERYRHHRHPVSRLWFAEIDSGRWTRFAATGPTQNGKSLMCYVAPVLYHLFEIGETVIVGLPSMDMANDKWQQDFRPVIEASRYRDLLPLKGEGSRGGMVKRSISFRNGATLRFMTAGGSDKQRAGYTSRVVAVTETDGMDESSETSREADKIKQIEGRTRAFGRTGKRVYLECTTSIEKGRIWQEVKQGTDSRILRPCPHCKSFVCPERENLVGWESAETEEEAAAKAFFACPECGEAWSEDDRQNAAKQAVLCHKGQEVTEAGDVIGPLPQTQTLGFRWSAIDNPFVTAGDLGAEEWKAKRSADRENAEKEMRQFVWVMPYEPPDVDLTPLDPAAIQQRKSGRKVGEVPADALGVVVQIDTGKRELFWTALAVRPGASSGGAVIEYGSKKVNSDVLGTTKGLIAAFRELRPYLERGWQREGGGLVMPSQVWVDSGYPEHREAVYAFCVEANAALPETQQRWRPTKGYGEGQRLTTRYRAPQNKDKDVVFIGREYYLSRVRVNGKLVPGVILVHVNSDYWKSELHQALAMPPDQPGAVVLYEHQDTIGHADFAAHLTAEKQVEKFLPKRGTVIVWERISRQNHWGDSTYGAMAGSDFLIRTIAMPRKPNPNERPSARDLAAKTRKA